MPFLYNPGSPTDLAPTPDPEPIDLASIMIPVTSVKRTGDAAADDARVHAALDAIAAGDFVNLPHE